MTASADSLFPGDWIIYDEMIVQDKNKRIIKGCTSVTSTTVVLFAGKFLENITPIRICDETSGKVQFFLYICIFD